MLPQLLPQLLLFGAFFVVVVTAWFSPKRYRPRCRVAVLVGTACVAPRSSFFIWLVTTLFCVVTAALVLYGSGAITVRSEWWRRYSDHKRTGRVLMVIDFTIAYVLLAFLLMLAPFQSTPFVWARWIGGAMYSPIYLAAHPGDIIRLVTPRPRPSVSSPRTQ